jgi:hypothetical protein
MVPMVVFHVILHKVAKDSVINLIVHRLIGRMARRGVVFLAKADRPPPPDVPEWVGKAWTVNLPAPLGIVKSAKTPLRGCKLKNSLHASR